MNNTNRALNRILLAVNGLLLLLIGAALIAIETVPVVRDGYQSVAPTIHKNVTEWLETLPLFNTDTSWNWVFILVALVLIVILLLIFVFRQGHGREQILVRENPTPAATTIIESVVAEQAIQSALNNHPEFITSSVSTYRVRKTPVLKVSVTCRRGVSPRDVTVMIESTLRAFDDLLGREIPALIQISGGFRARHSRSTRTE